MTVFGDPQFSVHIRLLLDHSLVFSLLFQGTQASLCSATKVFPCSALCDECLFSIAMTVFNFLVCISDLVPEETECPSGP